MKLISIWGRLWILDRLWICSMTVKMDVSVTSISLWNRKEIAQLLKHPFAVECWITDFVFFRKFLASREKGLHCRGYIVRAVLGHREWIAYLLHQWFSSRRGGWGSGCRALGKVTVLQTFWEPIIIGFFYRVSLWTSKTDVEKNRKTDGSHVHLLGKKNKT